MDPKIFGTFLMTHRTPAISSTERAALEASVLRTQSYAARQVLVREGAPLSQCTLLLEGMVHRYKDTPEGRRQILAIHVAGDFVDLHGYPLKRLEHSVVATTDVVMALVPHSAVRVLTETSATLTELLWRSTMIDAAINREWLASFGARAAAVRIAHLFCELYLRMERVGLAADGRFPLPLTQADLADATGLTPVHTNRMLRRLREQRLAEFREGSVIIRDWDGLKRFGEFDAGYLFLD